MKRTPQTAFDNLVENHLDDLVDVLKNDSTPWLPAKYTSFQKLSTDQFITIFSLHATENNPPATG